MDSKIFIAVFVSALISVGWAGYDIQEVTLGDNVVFIERSVLRNRTGAKEFCKAAGGELAKITSPIMFTILTQSAEIPVGSYWIDGKQSQMSFTAEKDCTEGGVDFTKIPDANKDFSTNACVSLFKSTSVTTHKLQLADCNKIDRHVICTYPKSLECTAKEEGGEDSE